MRRAAKIDANQTEIINALWAVGACVQSLAAIGNGVPDLLVGFRGELYLLEVKDGAKQPSKRQLTADQKNWHFVWKDSPLFIVQSVDDALRSIGATQ